MNISENLQRIKQGKDDIIKSLQNKGVSISENTLINEIPTIIDNAEIGGGDTPVQPELTPKYEGASVFRIEVPEDNYKFFIGIKENNNTTCNIDWGDGSEIEENTSVVENFHYYNKGVYDINFWNLSSQITLKPNYLGNSLGTDNGIDWCSIFTFIYDNKINNYTLQQDKYNDSGCVTHILIGDNITTIEDYAFQECTSLQSIVIPEGVTSIGENAFSYCSSLRTVELPSTLTTIGDYAFQRCTSLQNIVIPEGVTTIGNSVFTGCDTLQSIVIPEGVTTIGNSVFSNCTSLTGVNIPESVTSIGDSVFQYCTSLQSVVIPEGVTSIGIKVFNYCSSLQTIELPNTLTAIRESAFEECKLLQSVNIPNSVKSIGNKAFRYCVLFQNIVIPEGVTTIGDNAFSYCSSLRTVELPSTLTTIGDYAFQECTSLQSIVIPEGITSIGSSAFWYCASLQSVELPSTLTTIGYSLFQRCSSLHSVNIPESVTNIEYYAFRYCTSLQSVVIPEGVTTIGGYAFSDCTSFQSVVIPEGVTTIGESAFYNCNKLQSVTIPESVASIGYSAFNNCYCLELITCNSATSPIIKTSTFTNIGTQVPTDTPKYLYFPEGAEGYDEEGSLWKTNVIDKGYTVIHSPYTITPEEVNKLQIKYSLPKDEYNFPLNPNDFTPSYNRINKENDVYIIEFDNGDFSISGYPFRFRLIQSIELPENITSLKEKSFTNCFYLRTITCKGLIAPTIQSDTFYNIGTQVPTDIPKVLRVPQGSSGYDSGNWKTYVIDKGYTLEYI